MITSRQRPPPAPDARGRILRAAYDLFCREGIQAVGIDRVVASAGVAKMTLYRHFRSKGNLVLAVLELREELWSRGWLEGEVERSGKTPAARLLGIFSVFDDWFRRDDYEGCLFTNSLLESHDRLSPLGAASVTKRANIRDFVQRLAEEAGVREPENFAHQWQLLMTGAIIAAGEGDVAAARRARNIAVLMLTREGLRP